MTRPKQSPSNIYHIRIQETINASCAAFFSVTDWLEEFTLSPGENGETLLVGQFADQAALRGLLDHLWNLNFTILSVERLDQENE